MKALPIPGYEGRYSISDAGLVLSHLSARGVPWRNGPRLKRWNVNNKGYALVALFDGVKESKRLVSRLVLSAFVGPCPEGMEAAHLDGVPLNNSLANLAWVTHKENVGHQVLHGTQRRGAAHHWSTDARRGERHSRARLSAAEVEEIRALRAAGVRVVEIAARFGIHVRHAYAVAAGEFWR